MVDPSENLSIPGNARVDPTLLVHLGVMLDTNLARSRTHNGPLNPNVEISPANSLEQLLMMLYL